MQHIKKGGEGSFLMFHLCLLKCMIKLFFLSSFLFFLASLIMENYMLAVNIQTFLKGHQHLLYLVSIYRHIDRRNHFRHWVLESTFLP